MKKTEILNKAYGDIIKEPSIDWFDDLQPRRAIKFRWIKLIRFFTRRKNNGETRTKF